MGMKEIKGTIAKVIIGVFEGGKVIKEMFTRDVFVGGDIDPATGEWSPNAGAGRSNLKVSGDAAIHGDTSFRGKANFHDRVRHLASMLTRDLRVGGAYDAYGNWGPRNPNIVDYTPLGESVKNGLYISTMKIQEDGHYWLILPEGSNYLYKMQITEANRTRVFDVNEMPVIAAGTYQDNHYYAAENDIGVIFSAKTRVDSSTKTFDDGFVGQKRLNFQKNTVYEDDNTDYPYPAVEFYTDGPAEVKIWWVAGENNRFFAIQSEKCSGASRLDVSGNFVAHGNAEVKNTLTTRHLKVEEKAEIIGGIYTPDDIDVEGTVNVGNDLNVEGAISCEESLHMNGNDIDGVQSMSMVGTLRVENDSKLRSIKPEEDGKYTLGTEENSYDRVYANRQFIKDKETGDTVLIDYPTAKAMTESVQLVSYHLKDDKTLVLTSATEGSSKVFKITVNDTGVLSAVEWVVPFLKPSYYGAETWYSTDSGSFIDPGSVTKVTVLRKYTPTGEEDDSWNFGRDDPSSIRVYVIGTEVIIAGDDCPYIACDNTQVMFDGFSSLQTIDVSAFNTSGVTDMRYMFRNCQNVNNIIGLSNLDASNVTKMDAMFEGCESLVSIDLSNFKPSNLDTMHRIFYNCVSLTDVDLSNIDTTNTLMQNAFRFCSALTNLSIRGPIKQVSDFAPLWLSESTRLTHDSLMNVINALYDGTLDGVQRRIYLGSANLRKLTDPEKLIMTNKKWTYS